MRQRLVLNVDEGLLAELRRAAMHCLSVEEEAVLLLSGVVRQDSLAAVREIHARLAATGRDFGDTVADLREDRNR